MRDRAFIDTNVLVYAYDRSEPQKQRRALEVLDLLATSGIGAISTQVLAEFFVAVTRKIAAPLPIDEAYERVKNHLLAADGNHGGTEHTEKRRERIGKLRETPGSLLLERCWRMAAESTAKSAENAKKSKGAKGNFAPFAPFAVRCKPWTISNTMRGDHGRRA